LAQEIGGGVGASRLDTYLRVGEPEKYFRLAYSLKRVCIVNWCSQKSKRVIKERADGHLLRHGRHASALWTKEPEKARYPQPLVHPQSALINTNQLEASGVGCSPHILLPMRVPKRTYSSKSTHAIDCVCCSPHILLYSITEYK
jgi:hypothetical protein